MVSAAVPPSNRPAWPRPSDPRERASISALDGPDDVVLMTAVAHGDTMALDRLYRRYFSATFAAAYILVRDPSTAEEIAQDAFIRAWRGASSFQAARGSVRSWLVAIVRNIALDQLRAGQVAKRHQPGHALDADSARSGDDVPATVALADEADRLHAALAALPPPQREAVGLAFLAGLSHSEIAARTGVPLGTVKGRVRLGLRRLRADLADLVPDHHPALLL